MLGLPTAAYFQQLLQLYPTARYVLTVRDADAWYSGVLRHITHMTTKLGGMPERVRRLLVHVFGSADVRDKSVWTQAHQNHISRVSAAIPAAQLLVLDLTAANASWRVLCDFLAASQGPCAANASGMSLPVLQSPLLPDAAEDDFRLFASDVHGASASKFRPITLANASTFAYAASLINISTAAQHGYFKSFLIAVRTLRSHQAKHDVVALVSGEVGAHERDVLDREHIRLVNVEPLGQPFPPGTAFPRSVSNGREANVQVVWRSKLNIARLTSYKAVLFFDCDVVFVTNPDPLFEDNSMQFDLLAFDGVFTPLNAGFVMLANPSWQMYLDIDDIASTLAFEPQTGWLSHGPIAPWGLRRGAGHTDWVFVGASTDQGLLYYYFMCFRPDLRTSILPMGSHKDWFAHLSGVSKPFETEQHHDAPSPENLPPAAQHALAIWKELEPTVEAVMGTELQPPKETSAKQEGTTGHSACALS